MKVIKFFLLLIFSSCLFATIGLYSQVENLGIISTFYSVHIFQDSNFFFLYKITCILLLLVVFTGILYSVIRPIPVKEIKLSKEMGQLSLSVAALTSIVKCSVEKIVSNEPQAIKIKLTKKKLAVISVTIFEEAHLLTKSQAIQKQLALDLFNTMGIETKRVKVVAKIRKQKEKHNKTSTHIIPLDSQ